jgi:hypothetical protein
MKRSITRIRDGLAATAAALSLATPALAGDHGTSTQAPPAAAPLQWGDFDGDSYPDAVSLGADGKVSLLQNLGNGSLVDITDVAGLDGAPQAVFVLFEDVTGDGLSDLFLGRAGGGAELLRNKGLGFEAAGGRSGLPVSGQVVGAHGIDYDADGRMDLHVVTDEQSVMLHALWGGAYEAVVLSTTTAGDAAGHGAGVGGTAGGSAAGEGAEDEAGEGSTDQRSGPAGADQRGVPTVAGVPGAPSAAIPLVPGGTLDVRPGGFTGGSGGTTTQGSTAPLGCMGSIADAGGPGCLQASTVPTLGMLHPLSEDFFVKGNGRVGVGTTDPQAWLHIVERAGIGAGLLLEETFGIGSAAVIGLKNELRQWNILSDSDPDNLRIEADGATRLAIAPSGNVGIGTETPSRLLHVMKPGTTSAVRVEGKNAYHELLRDATSDDAGLRLFTGGQESWFVGLDNFPPSQDGDLQFKRGQGSLADMTIHSGTGDVEVHEDLVVDGTLELFEDADVNGDLDVNGSSYLHGPIGNSPAGVGVHIGLSGGGDGAIEVVSPQDSPALIDFRTTTETDYGARLIYRPTDAELQVDGDVMFSVPVLEIRGGADIVESFESSCGALEPGTVVAIDPDRPGMLMCSSAAYDTKVAGVVSGAGGVNPGLMLGQDDLFTGDTKVAMTGRVYVKCTTEGGPVRPGDRLTTSSLAGHAMRVVDSSRADGAVIGKAMSPLEDGTGLVLVLVNLQ